VSSIPSIVIGEQIGRAFAQWVNERAAVEIVPEGCPPIAGQLRETSNGVVQVELEEPINPSQLPASAMASVTLLDADEPWQCVVRLVGAGPFALSFEVPERLGATQRRRIARQPFRRPVDLLFGVGERVYRRRLLDASRAGLGVVLQAEDTELVVGVDLDPVRLSFPLGLPMVVRGAIRHVRKIASVGDGVFRVAGVALSGLSPLDAQRLDRWSKMLNKMPAGPPGSTLQSIGDCTVCFAGPDGVRSRAVLRASAMAVDVALDDGDEFLAPHGRIGVLSLRIGGDLVAVGKASVMEVLCHRNRAVRATLLWTEISTEARRQIVQAVAGSSSMRGTG
jgi:hypothetical protein